MIIWGKPFINLNDMKKIVVLSGAGISAESGIKTFRDADGLWEGHDVMEVATPQGWMANRALVLKFYNDRRRQLFEVEANDAHKIIASLESCFQIDVITQNVDDLHERAGSTQVLHLHGELKKSRSTINSSLVYECLTDIKEGDLCEEGSQLRPHIVWFGENVPLLEIAAAKVSSADIVIVIGTSMQVYPAAGLVGYAKKDALIYYIDPKPNVNYELARMANFKLIEKTATEGMRILKEQLLDLTD